MFMISNIGLQATRVLVHHKGVINDGMGRDSGIKY
jgi:hypothetical protein